jgi:hypothetical protein
VRLELAPIVPGLDDAGLRRALETAGVRLDLRPRAVGDAWARTTAREAVDNQPVPARAGSSQAKPDRQALSPRRTRGATRA